MAQKKVVPSFDLGDEVALVTTTKQADNREEFEKVLDQQPQSAEDMLEKFTKIVYVIDVSGSMNSGMAPEDIEKLYKWTPQTLADLRTQLAVKEAAGEIVWRDMAVEAAENAKAAAAAMNDDLEDFDEDDEDYEVPDDGFEVEEDDEVEVEGKKVYRLKPFDVNDDSQLKRNAILQGLHHRLGVEMERISTYSAGVTTRSKLEVVKDSAKKFVANRFRRYPESHISIIEFADTAREITIGQGEKAVVRAIESLGYGSRVGGGTNIEVGVERAIRECELRPSQTKTHHIILITDGQDSSGRQIYDTLLPRMKATNIVMDLFYVIDPEEIGRDEETYQGSSVAFLRKTCYETGGDYHVIGREGEFEQTFLEVSNRKCLPPAR